MPLDSDRGAAGLRRRVRTHPPQPPDGQKDNKNRGYKVRSGVAGESASPRAVLSVEPATERSPAGSSRGATPEPGRTFFPALACPDAPSGSLRSPPPPLRRGGTIYLTRGRD